jgi:signal peptidase I
MDDQQDPGTLAPAPASEPDAGSGKPEPDKDAPAAKKKKKKSFGRELLTIVVAAAILTLLVKAFIIQVYRIPSASMENTLEVGDRVLVNKVVYHFRGIARGDIVVFSGQDSWGPDAPPPSSNPVVRVFDDMLSGLGLHTDQTYYIKRVIGLPGDRVACCSNGHVTVQAKGAKTAVELHETYLYEDDHQVFCAAGTDAQCGPGSPGVLVPEGRLWVMGDHRVASSDSRANGTIPIDRVIGRAFVVVWPFSRIKTLPVPTTFR